MFIYATLLVFVLSSTVIATETKSEPRAILHNKNTILTNYYYYRILGEDSNRPIYDNQAIRFKKAEDGSGVEAVAHFDIKNSESTLEVSGQNSGLLCYDNSLAMKKGSRTVRKLLVDLNKDEKTLDLEGLWGRQVDGKNNDKAPVLDITYEEVPDLPTSEQKSTQWAVSIYMVSQDEGQKQFDAALLRHKLLIPKEREHKTAGPSNRGTGTGSIVIPKPQTERIHKTLHLPKAILHNKINILTDPGLYYYRISGKDINGLTYGKEVIKFNSAEDGSGVKEVSYYIKDTTMENPRYYDNMLITKFGRPRTESLVELNKNKEMLPLDGLWGTRKDKAPVLDITYAKVPNILTQGESEQWAVSIYRISWIEGMEQFDAALSRRGLYNELEQTAGPSNRGTGGKRKQEVRGSQEGGPSQKKQKVRP